jgi:transcriptional regulator with XRE-family HTH domain
MTRSGAEARPTLGSAIRTRRVELGLSQETLAARVIACGDRAFRQSDVSRLERNRVQFPHRPRMQCLAAALELSLGELLARAGWVGADAVFGTDGVAQPEPVMEQLTASLPEVGLLWTDSRGKERPRSTPVDYQRLHEAIARAQATRARTHEILARCETLHELYNQPMRVRSRTDRDCSGNSHSH